jgi:hypothetical protein
MLTWNHHSLKDAYEPHKSREQNHDYYKGCLMCLEISVYEQRTHGHHKHCLGSI